MEAVSCPTIGITLLTPSIFMNVPHVKMYLQPQSHYSRCSHGHCEHVEEICTALTHGCELPRGTKATRQWGFCLFLSAYPTCYKASFPWCVHCHFSYFCALCWRHLQHSAEGCLMILRQEVCEEPQGQNVCETSFLWACVTILPCGEVNVNDATIRQWLNRNT
jgi:hypothetical protein